jgi:flagellar biosynthetic protein FliR
VPLSAFRAGPEISRVVLALGFTLMLWPQWKGAAAAPSWSGIVAGVAGEVSVGLAIGLALAIALEAFLFAAQMVTLQAGFGFASTIDPTSGADSTVLITLAQTTAGLLFFTSGADRLLVRALADSMRLAPPTEFALSAAWGEGVIRYSASVFSAGLRLAAPVIALLLLADAALSVLGRIQAQLQLVTLTMPLKLAATMLLLTATLGMQPRFFTGAMTNCIQFVEGLLRTTPAQVAGGVASNGR